MQDIIAKYRKIMEKPVPPPFDGYLRELLEALEIEAGKPVQKDGNTYTKGLQNTMRGVKADWTKSKGILENVVAGSGDTITMKG